MMKSDLKMLNHVHVDLDEYEEYQLSETERIKMKNNIMQTLDGKKKTGYRKFAVIAACAALVVVLSQTAFAKDIFSRIIKTIQFENASVVQVDGNEKVPMAIPDNLKGKLFDKNGNEATEFGERLYTKDGEEVVGFSNDEPITEKSHQASQFFVYDQSKIQDYLGFTAVMPGYIPEGFSFEKAEMFKDNDGSVSPDYVFIYYTNADNRKLIIDERRASDETGYAEATDAQVEEISLHGVKAALAGNGHITWQANGVIYSVGLKDSKSREEIIPIAESMIP